jgi:hypothetical protein
MTVKCECGSETQFMKLKFSINNAYDYICMNCKKNISIAVMDEETRIKLTEVLNDK